MAQPNRDGNVVDDDDGWRWKVWWVNSLFDGIGAIDDVPCCDLMCYLKIQSHTSARKVDLGGAFCPNLSENRPMRHVRMGRR